MAAMTMVAGYGHSSCHGGLEICPGREDGPVASGLGAVTQFLLRDGGSRKLAKATKTETLASRLSLRHMVGITLTVNESMRGYVATYCKNGFGIRLLRLEF